MAFDYSKNRPGKKEFLDETKKRYIQELPRNALKNRLKAVFYVGETEEIRTPASAATERCAGHYTTASMEYCHTGRGAEIRTRTKRSQSVRATVTQRPDADILS